MLLNNKRNDYQNKKINEQFKNCIQPNLIRKFDRNSEYRLKYPLATIHLLLCIIAYYFDKKGKRIDLSSDSIPALFFTDGVFNVLFKYPENVLNWLNYLRINEEWNPLKDVFENTQYSVFTLMKEMDKFFRERDKISIKNERGDRLRISNKDGTLANIEQNESYHCNINLDAKERLEQFLNMLSSHTKWKYNQNNWLCWNNLKCYKFTKKDFRTTYGNITINNYNKFIDENPLSWAITSFDNIEFTIEEPDTF